MQKINSKWEKFLKENYTTNNKKFNIKFKTKYIIFILIVCIIYFIINNFYIDEKKYTPHIALITINGTITKDEEYHIQNIINSLTNAFSNNLTKGIILNINSPGGSPVQSHIIHDHIIKLRKENINIKIYSLIEDIGASGAYLIASATHKIYCNKSSIVGSIGVILHSFNVNNIMKKIGIDRKLFHSGKNKGMLDPFSEQKSNEIIIINKSLNIVHEEFIKCVKNGRGSKLKYNKDIFSGKIWVGKEALNIGLIDGYYNINSISKNIIGELNIINYSTNDNLLNKISKNINNIIKYVPINLLFKI